MKITTQQIRQIINEEIQFLLKETYGETATPEQKVVNLFLTGKRESAEQALDLIRPMGDEFKKEVISQLQILIKQYKRYISDFDDSTTEDYMSKIHHDKTYAERALKAIKSDSLKYKGAFYTGDDGIDVH